VPVRVHEPLSVLDALEVGRTHALLESGHQPATTLQRARPRRGRAAQLWRECAINCWHSSKARARSAQAPNRGKMDLRTYGVGAQIVRECGVHKMNLMGQPRRMPSMAGLRRLKSLVTSPKE
jgi:3,4-dihydroxy 2-butanone 4-phosphate synthase/GTP cyclohydrolase II